MKKDDSVKIFVTFGSSALPELRGLVSPMNVMLVVNGESHNEARQKVFDSFIGARFFTSYPYEMYADEFKEKYGMREYTIEELESMLERINR